MEKKNRCGQRINVWNLLMVIVVGTAIVIAIILFFRDKAHAERKFFMKERTLSVWVKTMDIEVPVEVTREEDFEAIFKVYSGQLKKTTVTNQRERRIYFDFPLIKEEVVYIDKVVTYRDGELFAGPPRLRPVEQTSLSFNLSVWGTVLVIVLFVLIAIMWTKKANQTMNELTAQVMPGRSEQVDRG